MTWIEVVDSAVKIGLGALIAGVASLLLTRAQHRNNVRKDAIDREFQLLKDVGEKVERFTQSALKYWAHASDWHRSLRSDPATPKPQSLKTAQAALFDHFGELTNAEASLLLLGHEEAQGHLRTYGEYVSSFTRHINNPSDPLVEESISDYRTYFLRARSNLFKELNRHYRELGP
ncbi:MAG: hypothetical protein EON58_12940 [Alphaproteobacteria bacterium]|nr:MAG: hypothetical protein EON58_12940 [Alphaproteobacteria bacterium]